MLGTLSGVRVSTATLPDDNVGGWKFKAAIMRQLAQHDTADLEMQEHWREAQHRVPSGNPIAEIRAWHAYIQKRIRYTPASLPYTQVFVRPAVLFKRGYGDCVAKSTAAGAGFGIGGYDSDLIFISTRSDKLPSHVYNRVWYPARTHLQFLAFDVGTRTPKPLGWEVPMREVTWFQTVPLFGHWSEEPDFRV